MGASQGATRDASAGRNRTIARMALAAAVTLVLFEIAFRVYAAVWLPGYTPSGIRARTLPPEVGAAERAGDEGESYFVVPHPYLGYVEASGATLEGMLGPDRLAAQVGNARPDWLRREVSNVGFVDARDYPFRRDPDDYLILVVGGSVARWLALQGGPTLAERIEDDPRFEGRDVVVVNAAVGGYKQPQQLLATTYLYALGLEPDAVINVDGFNEVALAMQNVAKQVSPAFPSATHWAHVLSDGAPTAPLRRALAAIELARARRDDASRAAHRWSGISNVAAYWYVRRAETHAAEAAHRELEYKELSLADVREDAADALAGPWHDEPIEERVREIVGLWSRGSRGLAAFCAELDVHYLHLLQPTAHDWNDGPAKPFTPAELDAIGPRGVGLALAVEELYPRLRAELEALAADGIAARDCSRLFANEPRTLYYDRAHVNQLGNELFAEHAAELFLATVRLPER